MLALIPTFCIALLGVHAPLTMAACTLQTLQDASAAYLSSVESGSPSALLSKASYKENNKAADITKGLLSQTMKIDHNKTLFDTTLCATYSELIITDTKAPYVIGTQVHLDDTGAVALVDTIVTTTGDWQFSEFTSSPSPFSHRKEKTLMYSTDATKSLSLILKENWDPIPPEKRDTRSTLQAAADAYLDLWSQNATKPVVPCV